MTAHPDLFTPRYPDAPGHRGVDTSIAAAEEMKPRAATLRAGVLECLRANPDGLTADECAVIMGEHWQNIRPRCSELRGQITDTGRRRPNSSGKNAIVWRIAQ